jgi:DNA (cytosine-5)-methyltransferase 1
MDIISLFAGAGGLDRGFDNAGFNIIWANEYDKSIWKTYSYNHPNTELDKRPIQDIDSSEIPDNIDGIIGGPPCQSWSLAGAMRGINDERGLLFYEYLRVINAKQPKFFLAENVKGMTSKTHIESFLNIINLFESCGYNVSYEVLNACNYGVPQSRSRVVVIGYRNDLHLGFNFSNIPTSARVPTLRDAIYGLPEPLPAIGRNRTNGENLAIPNHEYMVGGFSSIYMSRNRKRDWDEPSFTIQAGGRHAPLHPESAPMIKVGKDKWVFDKNTKYPYRRLSVRECARIQTFPDDFIFIYDKVADGYKMVGNAVPVKLSNVIANQILTDLFSAEAEETRSVACFG